MLPKGTGLAGTDSSMDCAHPMEENRNTANRRNFFMSVKKKHPEENLNGNLRALSPQMRWKQERKDYFLVLAVEPLGAHHCA